MASPSGSSEVELPREPSSSSSVELPSDPSSSSREIEVPPSPPSSSSSSPLPSPFKDVFASLPASGPTTHAHIFELSDYAGSSAKKQSDADRTISLQDAVVTILFHTSRLTRWNRSSAHGCILSRPSLGRRVLSSSSGGKASKSSYVAPALYPPPFPLFFSCVPEFQVPSHTLTN